MSFESSLLPAIVMIPKRAKNAQQKPVMIPRRAATKNLVPVESRSSASTKLLCRDAFGAQIFRRDMLQNMLCSRHLPGRALFALLMRDGAEAGADPPARRQGWIFESLCSLLVMLKCFPGIDYTEMCEGQLQSLRPLSAASRVLDARVEGGGNNVADITLRRGKTLIAFSVKYNREYADTDACRLSATLAELGPAESDFKVGLIVRDRALILEHAYNNNKNIDKVMHDRVAENGLLFDETDVVRGLDAFRARFAVFAGDSTAMTALIDSDYLGSPRRQLRLRLHQELAMRQFRAARAAKETSLCLAHKPRSGKSITLLLMCVELLRGGAKRVLVMTAVPATIDSFVAALEGFLDFAGVRFARQVDIATLPRDFMGIVFCSTQFLKTKVGSGGGGSKKNPTKSSTGKNDKQAMLTRLAFDAVIADEAHMGSATERTRADIMDADGGSDGGDDDPAAFALRAAIPLKIFASGTARKARAFYHVAPRAVLEWELEDEAAMKAIGPTSGAPEVRRVTALAALRGRHGPEFEACLADESLDADYSVFPTQALIKHALAPEVMRAIDAYNAKHGTSMGYSWKYLLALAGEEGVFRPEFALTRTADGVDILVSALESVCSANKMRDNTIMRKIEHTQSRYHSRMSLRNAPKLFLAYMPMHTGHGPLAMLQSTLAAFLEEHKLWSEYSIEYSSATEDSGDVHESSFDDYIKNVMVRCKARNKRGCILLLGAKGTVGITYSECDATISFDDGHSLDGQQQRFARALTEATGKTVGINVDMNVQRAYTYLNSIVQKHRASTNSSASNAEILYYLYKNGIFLFNPEQFAQGAVSETEIVSYYAEEARQMLCELDDDACLETIECDDDMRAFILADFRGGSRGPTETHEVNPLLLGENLDCPVGTPEKSLTEGGAKGAADAAVVAEKAALMEVLVNQTLEMSRTFLFPLLALLSRIHSINDFKEIFVNARTRELVFALMEGKGINLKGNNYSHIIRIMSTILDGNCDVVTTIREIYAAADARKVRSLIEKHFIPSASEKTKNAEIPTPVSLVDEMLAAVPVDFWKSPKRVFEPCCGKGNFVLGIFDKFFKGLTEEIPDCVERCRVIVEECLYFADLTAMNVFITTEILKCHAHAKGGSEDAEYTFLAYTGDTLTMEPLEIFGTEKFDAVVGNPPYNASGKTATGNTIWQLFTKKALNEWIVDDGYLLFVHPSGWRKPNTEKGKFVKLFNLMVTQNQMVYLEIHGIKDGQRVFRCGTRYDWYLIKRAQADEITTIVDEVGNNIKIDLRTLQWLPNSNIDKINSILAKNKDIRCPIMYDRSSYGADKKERVCATESEEFKYVCVHSTPKSGVRYMYSNVNNRGHFGISKIIFGDSGINTPVIDIDGEFGMTQHAMGIQIESRQEGEDILHAIQSNGFKEILQSCAYSTYAIDWNIFREFKKDFWKEFV